MRHLVDAFGSAQILEAVLPEIAPSKISAVVTDEFHDRLGTNDLSAVCRVPESAATVEGATEEVTIPVLGRSRVKRHAHRDDLEEAGLGGYGSPHRLDARLEGGGERVTGCREHPTALSGNLLMNDPIVFLEEPGSILGALLPEPGGSFDVSEKEGQWRG
jgi:hypothetical protein